MPDQLITLYHLKDGAWRRLGDDGGAVDSTAKRDATLVYNGSYRPHKDTVGTVGIPSGTVLTNFNPSTIDNVTLPLAVGDPSYGNQTFLNGDCYITDKIIHGDIRISATFTGDIYITRCLLVGGTHQPTTSGAILDCSANGARTAKVFVKDSEIVPQVPANGRDCVKGYKFSLERVFAEKGTDIVGIFPLTSQGADADVQVLGCHLRLTAWVAPDDLNARAETHNDIIQIQAGTNIAIRGNYIEGSSYALQGTPSTSTPVYYGYTNQGIIVQKNSGTAGTPDTTVVIEYNWVWGCAQQTLYKNTVATGVYRYNKHYRAVAVYTGSSGYWIRFQTIASTTITDLATNTWVDGPYVGQVLTQPRDKGIEPAG